MPKKHTLAIGRTLRRIARLRGGGSALPGLWIERLEPGFLSESLASLPHGVVLVSGTNGKTTTTKMITELLESTGLKVFTNKTGSNFTRGVVSALIEVIDKDGKLPYDIAVLELDEAHAVQFVAQVQPRISLFLNVLRDQLDRFGEIDYTAKLLGNVAAQTTETVVLNRDDPLTRGLAKFAGKKTTVSFFGAHENVRHLFPSDDLTQVAAKRPMLKKVVEDTPPKQKSDVELAAFKDQTVAFHINGTLHKTDVKLSGFYNYLNAAAALSVVRAIRPKQDTTKLLKALSSVEPAFGRGEKVNYQGKSVEFILVKNPSGFRLALTSARNDADAADAVMIAINDSFADGRDMSWLWDVDFSSLKKSGVQMISGIRCYDMALRLQYDNIPVSDIEPGEQKAFDKLLSRHGGKSIRIYCTYTAMLTLRRIASKRLKMERAL